MVARTSIYNNDQSTRVTISLVDHDDACHHHLIELPDTFSPKPILARVSDTTCALFYMSTAMFTIKYVLIRLQSGNIASVSEPMELLTTYTSMYTISVDPDAKSLLLLDQTMTKAMCYDILQHHRGEEEEGALVVKKHWSMFITMDDLIRINNTHGGCVLVTLDKHSKTTSLVVRGEKFEQTCTILLGPSKMFSALALCARKLAAPGGDIVILVQRLVAGDGSPAVTKYVLSWEEKERQYTVQETVPTHMTYLPDSKYITNISPVNGDVVFWTRELGNVEASSDDGRVYVSSLRDSMELVFLDDDA
jgi:hypothetical protein